MTRNPGDKQCQTAPLQLAILDDYQNVAEGIFGRLKPAIEITTFPETLDARRADEKEALIKRLQPFDVVSTMRERTALPADVITQLPNLKLILTTGIFNASIAISTCNARGVLVAGTSGQRLVDRSTKPGAPSLSYQSTAQHTWALILAITRLVPQGSASISTGGWQNGFATSLSGKTMGILGLGRLGLMVARVAVLAFGMKVVAWSSSLTDEEVDRRVVELQLGPGSIRRASTKEELIQAADVLTLHYVLSERSKGIIGAKELALMKPTSFLVNTSRGPLVDEDALLACLKRGAIQGAALDVFDREPLTADSAWRTTRWGEDGSSNVVLTPHMGYVEGRTVVGWYEESADSLEKWLKGGTPEVLLT